MLAVWGTADIGLPQPGWRGATDRIPVNWTGGLDPTAGQCPTITGYDGILCSELSNHAGWPRLTSKERANAATSARQQLPVLYNAEHKGSPLQEAPRL